MRLFANLRIKYKLTLILVLPILGLLYFASVILMQKLTVVHEMNDMQHLTQLVVKASNVLHRLQRDRGMGVLFVRNYGERFLEQLNHEYSVTDQSLKEFFEIVQQFEQNAYNRDLYQLMQVHMEKATRAIMNMDKLRNDVKSLNITLTDVQKRYQEISERIFDLINNAGRSSTDKNMYMQGLGYLNLIRAKEKAGIERYILGKVFTRKTFEADEYKEFIEAVNTQHVNLERVLTYYITPEQQSWLPDAFRTEIVDETEKMRKIAYAGVNGIQENVDSEEWFKKQTEKIELLKQIEDRLALDLLNKAKSIQNYAYTDFNIALLITVIIILSVVALMYMVFISIAVPLNRAVDIAKAITMGRLDNEIVIFGKDDMGELLQTLGNMQQQLREQITEEKRITDEALRINRALNCVSTSVLISDNNHSIIYANEAVLTLFGHVEKSIQEDLPHFSLKTLLGSDIGMFYQHAEQKGYLLKELTNTYRSHFILGGLNLDAIANPVINTKGERLGTVVEFTDRTTEVATEQEVDAVMQAAAQGDFSQRIQTTNKTGFFKTFSDSLNQTLDYNQLMIKDLRRVSAALVNGDLTQTIVNRYTGILEQLKTDINMTVKTLTTIIRTIQVTSDSVGQIAEEIAQGNASLSQRTEEQAASLEQMVASMEEMTSTVQQTADNTQQATLLASAACEQAQQGGTVVTTAIEAMQSINHSSKKVADIIGVINEIAFQTNLLALNAAVEAARAGEQGRGFAVVASEVRNLAQRSATAAKEIKQLIQDSVSRVENGTRLVNQSGKVLQEIVNAVKKVNDIISEIATASREQSMGIHQVNQALAQMDQMTQQNAALVQQLAAASDSMNGQTQTMKSQVAFFKVADS